ncbi:hypothetical protein C9374_007870 [Naegleria lovaniensis]|uniref:Endo-beta-1,2-glucanase SGL domain-containing protein n=1 Tax=Naegleria lovaniensis TaxID=51637 RepID=A0AA88GJW7_NAELO|nr:uncharacterized protein C9374_007870 [Naegleria lovaniensis]KAG2378722.1 hypothetical protein C9374_007870 [Naegleria lovaniensis]
MMVRILSFFYKDMARSIFVIMAIMMMLLMMMSSSSSSSSSDHHSVVMAQFYPCQFAPDYSIRDFETQSSTHPKEYKLGENQKIDSFLMNVSYWEGKFAVHGVGLNMLSGLTYDGHEIDYDTSRLHDPLHAFSAPSKESLHLNMMALALNGHPIARNFFLSSMKHSSIVTPSEKTNPFSTSKLRMEISQQDIDTFILSTLKTKLKSYELFDNRYPGFGSLLPWFKVDDEGAGLLWDWPNRIPSLDNGQMIWALVGLEQVLREKNIGIDLANTIAAKLKKISKTVIPLFYDGNGHVRCVTTIKDIYGNPLNVSNYETEGFCYLDDPYEGELMDLFMDMMADWKMFGYSNNEREKIWIAKRPKLRAVKYRSKNFGDILVEEGYWYSAHEKWKYLVLPYLDIPVNGQIFLNGERARLVNSVENGIPGLYASVTKPVKRGDYDPDYVSACGIQQIASQYVEHTDIITPYGSFPIMLADRNIGLMWYLNMLQGTKMQGVHGSTESTNITGTAICPVVTWDSKITTLVSICGGISSFTSRYMKEKGIYERFYKVIETEWTRVFGNGPFPGSDISFDVLRPPLPIPQNMINFTQCSRSSSDHHV